MTRPRTDTARLGLLIGRITAHVEDPTDEDRRLLARHLACEALLLGLDPDLLRAVEVPDHLRDAASAAGEHDPASLGSPEAGRRPST